MGIESGIPWEEAAKKGPWNPEQPRVHPTRFLFDTRLTGWSLCIGAGTSQPLFPSWSDLIHDLVMPSLSKNKTRKATRVFLAEHVPAFGYDAIIQAARSLNQTDEEAFSDELSNRLYANFDPKSASDWPTIASAFKTTDPTLLKPSHWRSFLAAIKKRPLFATVSADPIAKIICKVVGTPKAPSSILSFNAEPLLYTLVNAHYRVAYPNGKATLDRPPLVPLAGAHEYPHAGAIPYYYCHGLLPLPAAERGASLESNAFWQALSTRRNLVFTELEYLDVAGSSQSWPATSFLRAAQYHPIVFLGVSLTDANMRRWLGLSNETRRRHAGKEAVVSPTHYWLTKRPKNGDAEKWVANAVKHLGVQVLWLKDWSDVGPALKRMLDLK